MQNNACSDDDSSVMDTDEGEIAILTDITDLVVDLDLDLAHTTPQGMRNIAT